MGYVDSCCTYDTLKTVRIQDKRLGCIYYSLVLATAAYILSNLFGGNTYLLYDDAIGSIRLLLVHYNHDTNITALPYCNSDPGVTCVVMDEHDVRYPDIDTNQLLLTSFISETHEKRSTACDDGTCNPNELFIVTDKYEYYIPDVEDYDLHISVAAKSPEFCGAKPECKYSSTTRKSNGKMTFTQFDGSKKTVHFAQNTSDVIPMSDILEAAGLHMDQPLPGQTISSAPIRHSGAVVFVNAKFSNVRDCPFLAPCGKNSYSYEVQSGEDTEVIYESKLNFNDDVWMGNATRTVLKRSGIKMVFSVSGQFGRFHFQTFLLTLTTALGLLAGTTLFVDMLAVYALPQKDMYSSWKYEKQVNRDDSLSIHGFLPLPGSNILSGRGNRQQNIQEDAPEITTL